MTSSADMQQDTVHVLARLMAGMPAETRIDLVLLIGDFYKEQAERYCPNLSREAIIINRRNFVVEILRRVGGFDAAAAAKKAKPDKRERADAEHSFAKSTRPSEAAKRFRIV